MAEADCFKEIILQIMTTCNIRKLKAHFGVSIDTLLTIWAYIKHNDIGCRPTHLLWTLHFLKIYPTELVGASLWRIDKETWSKWIKCTIELLDARLPYVLVILFSTHGTAGRSAIASRQRSMSLGLKSIDQC